jgi:hypothetical protein
MDFETSRLWSGQRIYGVDLPLPRQLRREFQPRGMLVVHRIDKSLNSPANSHWKPTEHG